MKERKSHVRIVDVDPQKNRFVGSLVDADQIRALEGVQVSPSHPKPWQGFPARCSVPTSQPVAVLRYFMPNLKVAIHKSLFPPGGRGGDVQLHRMQLDASDSTTSHKLPLDLLMIATAMSSACRTSF